MFGNALVASAAMLCLVSAPIPAQSLKFTAPSDAAGLDARMPALAEAALAHYHEADEAKRLDTLFRLQMAAGHWADADRTLDKLRARLAVGDDPQGRATDVQYQILVRARLLEAAEGVPFETAFTRVFHQIMDPMDNRAAALAARGLEADRFPVGISLHVPVTENLEAALARAKGKSELSMADAVALVRAWQVASAYRTLDATAPRLVDEDDHRRYVIEEKLVPIDGAGGVCALIVRPRTAAPLPSPVSTINPGVAETALSCDPPEPPCARLFVKVLSNTRASCPRTASPPPMAAPACA